MPLNYGHYTCNQLRFSTDLWFYASSRKTCFTFQEASQNSLQPLPRLAWFFGIFQRKVEYVADDFYQSTLSRATTGQFGILEGKIGIWGFHPFWSCDFRNQVWKWDFSPKQNWDFQIHPWFGDFNPFELGLLDFGPLEIGILEFQEFPSQGQSVSVSFLNVQEVRSLKDRSMKVFCTWLSVYKVTLIESYFLFCMDHKQNKWL